MYACILHEDAASGGLSPPRFFEESRFEAHKLDSQLYGVDNAKQNILSQFTAGVSWRVRQPKNMIQMVCHGNKGGYMICKIYIYVYIYMHVYNS
jgi:hypothetical protein